MSIQVSISSREVKEAIRKCLNEAAFHTDATMPYDIVAQEFAALFCKKNSKFNSESFLQKCRTDYQGKLIYIHN